MSKRLKDHLQPKPTKAELVELLKAAQEAKGQEAMAKIQAILDEYGLTLVVQQNIVLTPRQ